MDSQTETPSETALTSTLAHLYAALADADPLAAAPPPVAGGAHAVAAAFAASDPTERQRLLLRALDEAITALEVAATLAQEYRTGSVPPAATSAESASSPLAEAQAAFVASQPAYQALYHLRNALAGALRRHERALPPSVAASMADDEVVPPAH